ncbi:GNAT family N-acetyltransferase [Candidatus Woesebacteria bacterium]|nr:GNAT family N-acetyltransferase [Candidatus Woesebacteria bacterium]
MSPVFIQVSTEITLRSWTTANAADLFALVEINRPELSQWLPWVPGIREESDSLRFIQNSIQETANDNGLELGIFYHDVLVGCIGLHELNWAHKKTSIGYWLSASYQGKGIMTAAVRALVEYVFTKLAFNRVEIRAASGNQKSRAIALRLGFSQEGVLREAEFVGDTFLDSVVYSLLHRDWRDAMSSQK